MKHHKYVEGKPIKRSRKKLGLSSLILVALLIIATVITVRHVYNNNLQPVSDSGQIISVEVPRGTSTKQIADILRDKDLIRASWAFQWYVNNSQVRDKLQAGTYDLRPNQTVEQIVAQLTHGAVATKLVAILPGKRIDQVKQAFIDSGFQESEVNEAFNAELYRDSPVLADMPKSVTSLEGLLYPDSFQRDNNTKPAEIIRLSLGEMQDHLTPSIRSAFTKEGLTVYQGLTLASIVEREVANPDDRPTVAQVFIKRLKDDIPLGSDASDTYGAINDGVNLPSNTSEAADVAVTHDSLYNTRMHNGLPPTPISTTSGPAIEAVAKPSKTKYLFFVSGKDCKTYFSKTITEHELNVKKHGLSTDSSSCN